MAACDESISIIKFTEQVRIFSHNEKIALIDNVEKETNWTVDILVKAGHLDSIKGPQDMMLKAVITLTRLFREKELSIAAEFGEGSNDNDVTNDKWFSYAREPRSGESSTISPLNFGKEGNRRLSSAVIVQFQKNTEEDARLSNEITLTETADPASSEEMLMDENVWSYLLAFYMGDYKSICFKHGCCMRPRLEITEEQKSLYLEVTSSTKLSKQERKAASDEFVKLYRKVLAYVSVLLVPFPDDLDRSAIDEELQKRDALLIKSSVYHLICPKRIVDKGRGIIEKAVKQYQLGESPAKQPTKKVFVVVPYQPYECTLAYGLIVHVLRGNLVDQTTEVIVNPANTQLAHMSGAARAIADACGKELKDECQGYIKKHGRLRVGYVTHTTAGNLGPRVRYVLHAAGPDARVVQDRKECFALLKETFTRCLIYANEFLNVKTIAMPAISAGVFRVPRHNVAQALHSAVVEFDNEYKSVSRNLKEIFIVSLDIEVVDAIQIEFKAGIQASADESRNKSAMSQEPRDENEMNASEMSTLVPVASSSRRITLLSSTSDHEPVVPLEIALILDESRSKVSSVVADSKNGSECYHNLKEASDNVSDDASNEMPSAETDALIEKISGRAAPACDSLPPSPIKADEGAVPAERYEPDGTC